MTGRYNIEPSVMDDLKQVNNPLFDKKKSVLLIELTFTVMVFFEQVLKAQQEGMTQLMNILKEDFQDLHILENALKR